MHRINCLLHEIEKQNQKKEKKKKQIKKKQIVLHEQSQIYQKRLQQSELIQHETKWILEWKNIPIGDLYFPDQPTPLQEIRNYKI